MSRSSERPPGDKRAPKGSQKNRLATAFGRRGPMPDWYADFKKQYNGRDFGGRADPDEPLPS